MRMLLGLACITFVLSGCGSGIPSTVPQIESISPQTAIAGGSASVSISITGSGFAPSSLVTIGNLRLTPQFINSGTLEVSVPASLLEQPQTLTVAVLNLLGGTSNQERFTVVGAGVASTTLHPQVARYSISVPRDAKVSVQFGPDTSYGLNTWQLDTPPSGGQVELLVAGMRSSTEYHMQALVEFPDGLIHSDTDQTFTTGSLDAARLPNMAITRPDPSLIPQSGVQLFDATSSVEPLLEAFVTDLEGNVLWYYDQMDNFAFPIQFLENGNFLILDSGLNVPGLVREVNLAGETIREITAIDLQAKLVARSLEPVSGFFHHDTIMLPNGHIIILTAYAKTFTNLTGFESQEINVIGDGLVELDENLDPVWVWSSFDHMDVNRHPFSSPNPPGTFDWTHGNAVVYSPADGDLLLSLRHQHWVLKIDFKDGFGSGNILWRLGNEGDFTMLNGTAANWQYAQHFPFIIDNQIGFYRLAVFDNGNNRILDDAGTICGISSGIDCYSRGVIYEIDEAMNTVRQLWEGRTDAFAPFIGSVQLLANDNFLWDAGVANGAPVATIREVTQEDVPRTVWNANITGQFVYRSLRLPSLYPGVQW